jgi:HPr kinase/phosphorylase
VIARLDGSDKLGGQKAHAIHASALVVREAGVLIRGPSGAGKSGLTLALLALAGDRRRFARLVGDDRVLIRAEAAQVLVAGTPNIAGLVEKRGYGIVPTQTEPCAVVRLVVDLLAEGDRNDRLPEEGALWTKLCGINLPRLTFDARSAPFDRACAVFGYLENNGDKNVTGFAHFA